MNKPSILIIEDDKAVKNLIATTLEMHDYHYTWADKGEQGILTAASQRPDIILLDLGLPDMDGVDVILKIRSWTNTPHHCHQRQKRGQRQDSCPGCRSRRLSDQAVFRG